MKNSMIGVFSEAARDIRFGGLDVSFLYFYRMDKEPKIPWYYAPVVFITVIAGAFILHSIFLDSDSEISRIALSVQDPHYQAPVPTAEKFAEDAAKMKTSAGHSLLQYICLDSAVAHETYNVVDASDTATPELEIAVSSSAGQ
ncbi:MAG TPA: hypothetical protein VFJ29_03010 [Candidatus Kapabacteria bacterium]|nr:hypothetical protein [Candidatus Kapabacteria bacterium]